MDLDEFRTILLNSRVNVWEIIDAAISVASSDYGRELKERRDHIVERLFAATSRCENCDLDSRRRLLEEEAQEKRKVSIEMGESQRQGSPFSSPHTVHENDDFDEEGGGRGGRGGGEDERVRDLFGDLFEDDEETKILRIKEQIEDPEQSEDSLVALLQDLADMDITFKALKETDIGRHVNHLRKHPSNEVRRLVKQLVRKWKDLVDEWVKLKETDGHASSTLLADEDSPQQNVPHRNSQNGHHQVPDFAYSPNPHNGSSGSDKNNSEPELRPKPIPRRDAPAKQSHSLPISAPAPPVVKRQQQKESKIDLERLASARKRLHENYQEAQNGPHDGPMWPNMKELKTAKKQRTIQVMDIHEIPKPKNTFFAKNKGSSQGRHR